MTMPGAHESEASLLVDAIDPTPTARAVAALTECAGYVLQPRAIERLRDVYVDRADGVLAARRLGLRLRVIDDAPPLVTLKGKAVAHGHRLERLEVEGPLAAGGWDAVRAAAASSGVALDALPADGTPLERLATLGLVPTHERTTLRTPREVASHAAELVVDETSVRLRRGVARYVEIEIEAKAAAGNAVVDAMVDDLLARFAPLLRPWAHSKLAVGLTLARLDAAGELAAYLTDGWVQPSGMRRVAELLASEPAL